MQHSGSLIAACGRQSMWASVVVVQELSSCGSQALVLRLSSCGTRVYLVHGMWNLPGPAVEPMSPGSLLSTVPPEKSKSAFFNVRIVRFDPIKRVSWDRRYMVIPQTPARRIEFLVEGKTWVLIPTSNS